MNAYMMASGCRHLKEDLGRCPFLSILEEVHQLNVVFFSFLFDLGCLNACFGSKCKNDIREEITGILPHLSSNNLFSQRRIYCTVKICSPWWELHAFSLLFNMLFYFCVCHVYLCLLVLLYFPLLGWYLRNQI